MVFLVPRLYDPALDATRRDQGHALDAIRDTLIEEDMLRFAAMDGSSLGLVSYVLFVVFSCAGWSVIYVYDARILEPGIVELFDFYVFGFCVYGFLSLLYPFIFRNDASLGLALTDRANMFLNIHKKRVVDQGALEPAGQNREERDRDTCMYAYFGTDFAAYDGYSAMPYERSVDEYRDSGAYTDDHEYRGEDGGFGGDGYSGGNGGGFWGDGGDGDGGDGDGGSGDGGGGGCGGGGCGGGGD